MNDIAQRLRSGEDALEYAAADEILRLEDIILVLMRERGVMRAALQQYMEEGCMHGGDSCGHMEKAGCKGCRAKRALELWQE